MTVVHVKGKGNIEFPDDMSPEEIKAALQKLEEQKPEFGGDPRAAVGDALVSVARNIGAEIVGGVGGAIVAPVKGVDAAVEVIEGAREKIGGAPVTSLGKAVAEDIGKAGEVALKAVRAPFAGLAGLFRLPAGLEAAAGTVNRVMNEGIGETAGSALLEATGSPGVAATAKTVPTGLATLFGLKAPKPVPKPAPKPSAPKISLPKETKPAKADVDIAKDLRKGDVKTVADDVIPDRSIIEAGDRLGVDLNPEHYSTNAQFQEVARALKARAGTKLEAAERKALEKLSERADKLIDDLGGSTDKAAVSVDISNEMSATITAMEGRASTLYGKVDEAIPRATLVEPNAVREYLETTLAELGGDTSLLSSAERQLLALTRKKVTQEGGIVVEEAINPTYAALDRVRRNVGEGYQRRGPFKDDAVGNLDQVYRVLSEDQQAVADAFGVGEVYTTARSVVQKRKAIEDQAIVLFGRAMNESLVPRIKAAAQGLAKGDVTKFNKLMEALPEGRRAQVAATLLGDIFGAGSRTGGGISGGFVSAFNSLNRNTAAKELLFKHLPKGAEARFNDIGKVYSAIFKANQKPLSNPSGSAAPIIAALEDATVLAKIYNVSKKVAAAETVSSTVGLPGAGTAGVVGTILAKRKIPAVQAADDLLTSSEFEKAMSKALNGDSAGANKIADSKVFKKWLGTLDSQQQQRIASTGFIAWLVSAEEEDDRQSTQED